MRVFAGYELEFSPLFSNPDRRSGLLISEETSVAPRERFYTDKILCQACIGLEYCVCNPPPHEACAGCNLEECNGCQSCQPATFLSLKARINANRAAVAEDKNLISTAKLQIQSLQQDCEEARRRNFQRNRDTDLLKEDCQNFCVHRWTFEIRRTEVDRSDNAYDWTVVNKDPVQRCRACDLVREVTWEDYNAAHGLTSDSPVNARKRTRPDGGSGY